MKTNTLKNAVLLLVIQAIFIFVVAAGQPG